LSIVDAVGSHYAIGSVILNQLSIVDAVGSHYAIQLREDRALDGLTRLFVAGGGRLCDRRGIAV
jgi:hypothetical protein